MEAPRTTRGDIPLIETNDQLRTAGCPFTLPTEDMSYGQCIQTAGNVFIWLHLRTNFYHFFDQNLRFEVIVQGMNPDFCITETVNNVQTIVYYEVKNWFSKENSKTKEIEKKIKIKPYVDRGIPVRYMDINVLPEEFVAPKSYVNTRSLVVALWKIIVKCSINNNVPNFVSTKRDSFGGRTLPPSPVLAEILVNDILFGTVDETKIFNPVNVHETIKQRSNEWLRNVMRCLHFTRHHYLPVSNFGNKIGFDPSLITIKEPIFERDMNVDANGFGHTAAVINFITGGNTLDKDVVLSDIVERMVSHRDNLITGLREIGADTDFFKIIDLYEKIQKISPDLIDKLQQYTLILSRITNAMSDNDLDTILESMGEKDYVNLPIKDKRNLVRTKKLKERTEEMNKVNDNLDATFGVSLKQTGLFRLKKTNGPGDMNDNDYRKLFKRKDRVKDNMTDDEFKRSRLNKTIPDYLCEISHNRLNGLVESILEPYHNLPLQTVRTPGSETLYDGSGFEQAAKVIFHESERHLENVINTDMFNYLKDFREVMNTYVMSFCNGVKPSKHCFGLGHSKGKPWIILGTPAPNEQTSGIIILIGVHKTKPKVAEGTIKTAVINIGDKWLTITKPFRLHMDDILHFEERIGSYIGLKVMKETMGLDLLGDRVIDSLFMKPSRQITLVLDAVYLFYKSALMTGTFGNIELGDKLGPIVRKDPRVVYILDSLRRNFGRMADDLTNGQMNLKNVIDCITGQTFGNLQGFLSMVYLKQIIPKSDGYNKNWIKDEGFKKECGFQTNWTRSEFHPSRYPEGVRVEMDEWFDRLLSENDTKWQHIAYHNEICQFISEIVGSNIMEKDHSLANSMFISVPTVTTGKKSKVLVPTSLLMWISENYFNNRLFDGERISEKYELFLTRQVKETTRLQERLRTTKDPAERQDLIQQLTKMQKGQHPGATSVELTEGLRVVTVINEKLANETGEIYFGRQVGFGNSQSTLVDDSIFSTLFFTGDYVLMIKDKDQVGYGKRIFFIQSVHGRNLNKVVEDYFYRVMQYIENDLIHLEGDAKYIAIEKMMNNIKNRSAELLNFTKERLIYVTKDQTKFGDTYPMEAISSMARGLYRIGMLSKTELRFILFTHEKLKNRRILMPPNLRDKIDKFKKRKDYEGWTVDDKSFSSFLKTVIEEFKTVVDTSEPLKGPFSEAISYPNLKKTIGFVLGVLNFQSSFLSSCAIVFVKKALKELNLDGFYDEGTHSDDCLGGIGLKSPNDEEVMDTRFDHVWATHAWTGRMRRVYGDNEGDDGYRELEFKYCLDRNIDIITEDDRNMLENLFNGEEKADNRLMGGDSIWIPEQYITYMIMTLSIFSSRFVGQRASLAKTGFGLNGEVLQSYIYKVRTNIPLIRYAVAISKELPGHSFAHDLTSSVGRIYPVLNNGGSEILCSTLLLAINYIVGLRYNIDLSDMRVDTVPQLAGVWWCLPSLIIKQGFRANLTRLLCQSESNPSLKRQMTIMLDDPDIWKTKLKIRQEFGSIRMDTAEENTEAFAAVESFKDWVINYGRKLRTLASFTKLAEIYKNDIQSYCLSQGVNIDFTTGAKYWVKECQSKFAWKFLLSRSDKMINTISFLGRYLTKSFQESFARISPALKLRNRLGYRNRLMIHPLVGNEGSVTVMEIISQIRQSLFEPTKKQQNLFNLMVNINLPYVEYLKTSGLVAISGEENARIKRLQMRYTKIDEEIISIANALNGRDLVSAIIESDMMKIPLESTEALNKGRNAEASIELAAIANDLFEILKDAGISIEQIKLQSRLIVKMLTNHRVKNIIKSAEGVGPLVSRVQRNFPSPFNLMTIETGVRDDRFRATPILRNVNDERPVLCYLASWDAWLNNKFGDRYQISGDDETLNVVLNNLLISAYKSKAYAQLVRLSCLIPALRLKTNVISTTECRDNEGFEGIVIKVKEGNCGIMFNADSTRIKCWISSTKSILYHLVLALQQIIGIRDYQAIFIKMDVSFAKYFADSDQIKEHAEGSISIKFNEYDELTLIETTKPWIGTRITLYYSNKFAMIHSNKRVMYRDGEGFQDQYHTLENLHIDRLCLYQLVRNLSLFPGLGTLDPDLIQSQLLLEQAINIISGSTNLIDVLRDNDGARFELIAKVSMYRLLVENGRPIEGNDKLYTYTSRRGNEYVLDIERLLGNLAQTIRELEDGQNLITRRGAAMISDIKIIKDEQRNAAFREIGSHNPNLIELVVKSKLF